MDRPMSKQDKEDIEAVDAIEKSVDDLEYQLKELKTQSLNLRNDIIKKAFKNLSSLIIVISFLGMTGGFFWRLGSKLADIIFG